MNAKEKADILLSNGYKFERRHENILAMYEWRSPKGQLISSDTSKSESTNLAYKHWYKNAPHDWREDMGHDDFATNHNRYLASLPSEVPAPQDDSAALEHSAPRQFANRDKNEIEALQARVAELEAENAVLRTEIVQSEAKSALRRRALETLSEDSFNWSMDRMRRFAKASMQPTKEAIDADITDLTAAFEFGKEALKQTTPTPSTPATPAPKLPVSARVNWSRGYSSGAYPVLGFSNEKQTLVLNISSDDTRVMAYQVKMARCEVQYA